MRIYFKRTVILIVILVLLSVGISIWFWWNNYYVGINDEIRRTRSDKKRFSSSNFRVSLSTVIFIRRQKQTFENWNKFSTTNFLKFLNASILFKENKTLSSIVKVIADFISSRINRRKRDFLSLLTVLSGPNDFTNETFYTEKRFFFQEEKIFKYFLINHFLISFSFFEITSEYESTFTFLSRLLQVFSVNDDTLTNLLPAVKVELHQL